MTFSMEALQKEVKSAFSSGQSTADFISFESLDRTKVHSMASKAMSKRTNRWQLKRRRIFINRDCIGDSVATL
jgi:hypothetical protein